MIEIVIHEEDRRFLAGLAWHFKDVSASVGVLNGLHAIDIFEGAWRADDQVILVQLELSFHTSGLALCGACPEELGLHGYFT